jgi:hypothetical protein
MGVSLDYRPEGRTQVEDFLEKGAEGNIWA